MHLQNQLWKFTNVLIFTSNWSLLQIVFILVRRFLKSLKKGSNNTLIAKSPTFSRLNDKRSKLLEDFIIIAQDKIIEKCKVQEHGTTRGAIE